ncbi:uncharacterized protein SAPINGB_P002591 [Magnusiomyces paraingens]|uniref:Ubiquitin-like protease family profile domain-containing protein n=1 Tax=Magnusiomyces paraingens TaxID=2606893 RepID=A0A5E8BGU7_9ASCO|nr:uncharacterized protein SAPINGB_P002591 [Saprochaete ingens]VVT50081.1 unnamed protein product [Saprochaete ingens]
MASFGIKPKDNLSNPNSKKHPYIQLSAHSHIFSDAQKREIQNHISSDQQCKRPRLSAPILTTDVEYMSRGTEKCDPDTLKSKYVLPITRLLINNSQSMTGNFLLDISDDYIWKFWNISSCDLITKIPFEPSKSTTVYFLEKASCFIAKNGNETIKVFFDPSTNVSSFVSSLKERGIRQPQNFSSSENDLIRKPNNVNRQIHSQLSSLKKNNYPSSNTWNNDNNPYLSVQLADRVNSSDMDILRDAAHKNLALRSANLAGEKKHKLWGTSTTDSNHEEEYNQQLEKEYRLNSQKRQSLLSNSQNDITASSNKKPAILKKNLRLSKYPPPQSLKPITSNTSKISSTKTSRNTLDSITLDSDDLMSDLSIEISNQENHLLSHKSLDRDSSKPPSIFDRPILSTNKTVSTSKTKPSMPSCFHEIKQSRLQSLNTQKPIVKPENPPKATPTNPFKNGTVDSTPVQLFSDDSFTLDPGPILPFKPRIVTESKIISSTPTITTIEAKVRPSQSAKNIEWFDKIKSSFNESFSFVFKDGKSMDVGPYDVARLNQGEFLNDTIVNFYLKFFLEKHPELKERVHLFNTFFYEKLQVPNEYGKVSNFEKVRKWTTKANLFSRDFIIIPIHMKMHWYVTIVYNLPALLKPKPESSEASSANESSSTRSLRSRDRTTKKRGNVDFNPETDCYIFICDSLQGSRYDSLVKNLKAYFVAEAKDKLDKTIDPSRIISRSVSVPQQTNYSDCGVYLIHFVQCFFDAPDKFAKLMSTHDPVADKELSRVWNPTLMKREVLQRMLLYYRHLQENKINGTSGPSDPEDLSSIIKVSSEGLNNGPVTALPVTDKIDVDPPSEPSTFPKSIDKPFKPPTFVTSTDTTFVDKPNPAKRQQEFFSINNSLKNNDSLDNDTDMLSDKVELDLKNLEINKDNSHKLPPDVEFEISIDSPSVFESNSHNDASRLTAQKSQSIDSQNSYEISSDEVEKVKNGKSLQRKSIANSSTSNEILHSYPEKKLLRNNRVDSNHLLSDDEHINSFSDVESKSIVSIDDETSIVEEPKPQITTKSLQPSVKKKLEFKEKVTEHFSKIVKGNNSKKDLNESESFIEHAYPPRSSFRKNPKIEKPSYLLEKESTQASTSSHHTKKAHTTRFRQVSTEEKPLVAKHQLRSNMATSGVSFKNARELEPVTTTLLKPHIARKSAPKKAKVSEAKPTATANQAALSPQDNDEDDDIQIVDCQSSKPLRKKRG